MISRFFALQAQSLCFNTMCLDHCGGSKFDLPVLRPAGSITAFQHHVTRSLRRFNVGSLVFILLSVQCSLVLRPWIFLRCSVFILLLVHCSLIRRLWISLFVQCSYLVLFGSSPCWLDHCVSTPFDSITAAVLITMWLDHCVTPCESNTAVVTKELGSLCLAETPQLSYLIASSFGTPFGTW